ISSLARLTPTGDARNSYAWLHKPISNSHRDRCRSPYEFDSDPGPPLAHCQVALLCCDSERGGIAVAGRFPQGSALPWRLDRAKVETNDDFVGQSTVFRH